MPASHTIAILGCAGAILLGATALGTARLIPDDSYPARFDAAPVSTTFVSDAAARVQQAVQDGLKQNGLMVGAIAGDAIAASASDTIASSAPRGSLHFWREANARRAATGERSPIVMPGQPTRAVTAERLAYERELFSREVKDNMLVPKANARLANADGDKRAAKGDATAQASVVDAARVSPQKPKKKRIVRARPDPRGPAPYPARMMAFGSPFGSPFAMR